jgi:protoheme IX farnesyltransferase
MAGEAGVAARSETLAEGSRGLAANRARPRARALDRFVLLKPRVMSLAVFTGAVGFLLAPGPIDWLNLVAALAAMAAGAGACGALNMWWEGDIDAQMARTARRPIPRGAIDPREALAIGAFLSLLSVAALGLRVNWLAAGLLALTIVIYIPVYTIWLKQRTALNIVIGGAAGALPPMIGWAAAAGAIDAGPLALFLFIFLWTPPHFWSLALCRSGDYQRAGVPMLPNVVGPVATCRRIAIYVALLVPASFAPLTIARLGAFYAVVAAGFNAVLVWRAAALYRLRDGPEAERRKAAMALFGFSILYMFALFAAMLGETMAQ